MLHWLLSHEALQVRMVRAIREARTPLTAKAPERKAQANHGLPSTLQFDGATATISVRGVLTPTPDAEAAWFDEPNTLYPDLQESLRVAAADPRVRDIVWDIDSPGGAVDGLFALLDDIADARASGARMSVIADNAHSAAYGIAAAVGNITARSRMSSFGSVGVATSGFISGGLCGTVVDIASSDAPEKRPDLATPEGKAVVQRYLDQIAGEFMGAIAAGRGVSVDAVKARYGRGASMLAGHALESGLIDHLASRPTAGRTLADANGRATVGISMANEASDPVEPAPAPAEAEPEAAPESKPVEAEPAKSAPEDAAAPSAAPAPSAKKPSAADAPRLVTAAEYAELLKLRADRVSRETAERRSLVTALVELGAETPATAWKDNAPTARLASEPLSDMRERVAALRLRKPAAGYTPPPAGAGAVGEDALEDFERADAAKIKDPDARARFVASRLARKQK